MRSVAEVERPVTAEELAAGVDAAPNRGVIARGLGRSYGDTAQNGGGRILDTTGVSGLLDVDLEAGTATALAGTSLRDLMRWLVPLGYFVPVSPGTAYVTVGGAIANDIHGKNHHSRGSWCDHVKSMRLHTPATGTVTVSPDTDADLFWATAGGIGLTGIVLDATFDLHPIETAYLSVDTTRTRDLDEVMALEEGSDAAHEYSVAWIDLTAKGASLGRSILMHARFASVDELPARLRRDPLAHSSSTRQLLSVPPAPPKLLNRATIRAFNEFWYHKAPKHRVGHIASIPQFFHPLDVIRDWNRAYGPHGFLQWQFVVPFGAERTLRSIIDALVVSGYGSGVTVLKRFGPGNSGHLSFPQPGWTLTVDFPAEVLRLGQLLDRLDEQVVEAGGRLYLAKDSRMRPNLLAEMYPRLDEWRLIRKRVDPDGVLQSDQGRRLGL
jgi:decaprenylphospho-beta-D-ribofuranose 2-oxidase